MLSIVSGSRLPYDQLSSDSDSSTSSNASNLSQQDRNDDELSNKIPTPPWTELGQAHDTIASFLSNLYKTSALIRRNQVSSERIIKSAKIDTSFYEPFDRNYVREKYPAADVTLVQRLGAANSRRRKYLKYRSLHRQKLSQPQEAPIRLNTKQTSAGPLPEAVPGRSMSNEICAQDQGQGTPSLRDSSYIMESTKASTFHVTDVPAVNIGTLDEASDAGTQTTLGSTSSVGRIKVAIPPPPKAALEGKGFECPYCYTICHLRATMEWKQHREWKRHVLRDLQPYICTFGDCNETNTLFERRRDWIDHELQTHRREWYCNTPEHEPYKFRVEFQSHMRHQHSEQVEEGQLDVLADLNARPAVHSKYSCPLCRSDESKDLSIDRLEAHLGRHLEAVACFVLPLADTGSRISQDSASTKAAVDNDSTSHRSSDDLENEPASSSNGDLSAPEKDFPSIDQYVKRSPDEWAFIQRNSQPTGPETMPNEHGLLHEICAWLTTERQAELLSKFASQRHTETGNWFFDFQPYLDLKDGAYSILLVEGLR